MILKTSSDSHIDHLKFVSCKNKKYTDASSDIVFWLLWSSPWVLVMFAQMLGTVHYSGQNPLLGFEEMDWLGHP